MIDALFVVPGNAKGVYQKLSADYSAIETPTWALLLAESCRSVGHDIKILDVTAEKLSHQILKNGVTDLVYSVDSYTKEEYESIRVKGVFEEVLNNIKRFKEIKKQYSNSKCATRISGVKVNPEQDPQKFKDFWQQHVDHVVMVEMENRWDTYNNPMEIAGKNPCQYLWERMYVWYDGVCNPCDADYKSELSTGSVLNNSISEIWNGQKYSLLRNAHLDGKRSKCYPCDRCPNGS